MSNEKPVAPPLKPAPAREPAPRSVAPPEAREPDRGPTHLLARSRNARFSRGGLSFTSSYQAFELKDLKREQVERILAEPMLDARLVDENEVRRHVELKEAAITGDASPAELAQMIMRLHSQNEMLQQRVAYLEAKISGTDLPPESADKLPGLPPTR